MTSMVMLLLQQSQWAELEADIVFSSFVINWIKRFAADIKFLCSCFFFSFVLLANFKLCK